MMGKTSYKSMRLITLEIDIIFNTLVALHYMGYLNESSPLGYHLVVVERLVCLKDPESYAGCDF